MQALSAGQLIFRGARIVSISTLFDVPRDGVGLRTGDALAAKELLRHKDLAVTTNKYVKAIPEALLKGIKLLEAAATAHEEPGFGE